MHTTVAVLYLLDDNRANSRNDYPNIKNILNLANRDVFVKSLKPLFENTLIGSTKTTSLIDLITKDYTKIKNTEISTIDSKIELAYNKALSLAANMEDEPCDAESDTIPGEKCSGPTGDELQGTIMRTWGRGRRKVKCDVCKGTGIKPKTNFPIKWI